MGAWGGSVQVQDFCLVLAGDGAGSGYGYAVFIGF